MFQKVLDWNEDGERRKVSSYGVNTTLKMSRRFHCTKEKLLQEMWRLHVRRYQNYTGKVLSPQFELPVTLSSFFTSVILH